MSTRNPFKSAAAMAARLRSGMNRKIAIAGIVAASVATASAGNFSTTTTNVVDPNGYVVTDATGTMVSYSTFTNNVAQAFATNSGGVWNFDAPSGWSIANGDIATLTYGSAQTNALGLTGSFINGDSVNQQGPSGGTLPTSGTTFLGQNGAYQDTRSFVPNKPLVAVGLISINRGDATRIAALSVTYLDGTTAATTNGLGNAAYFHGLTANPTNPIVKFTIINAATSSGATRWDDLAFIVGPPLPVLPPDTNAAVSINFNGIDGSGIDNAQADSLAATDSAGASGYARTNWNNLNRWGDLTTGVKDNSGTDSGLQIRWDAAGVGSSGSASLGTPDGKMMDGMDETDWGGGPAAALNQNTSVYGQPASDKPMVYVSGLQAYMTAKRWTNYAVVMYVNGWHGGNGVAQHWIQAVTNGTVNNMALGNIAAGPLFTRDSGAFNGTYSQVAVNCTNSASASGGNFIVFGGLTNNSILLCTGEPNNSWQAGQIMGFQIVNSALATSNAPLASVPTISPSATVFAGVPVTLTEAATPDPNDPRLWYQWQTDYASGNPPTNSVLNETNATYTFTPTNSASTYTLQFQVVVTNLYGAVTSSVVTLTVNPAVPPYVTTDTTPGQGNGLANVYAFANGNVSFSAAFDGTRPITYQWQGDVGSGYSGILNATNTTLTLTNLQLANSGNYRLMAHNAFGDTPSTPAPLTVLPDPAAPDAGQAYAYAVSTNNPYAYWRFSETIDPAAGNYMQAYDYSGHNFNATYGNAVYIQQAGPSASSTPATPGLESTNTGVTFINNTANSWLDVPSLNLNTNTVTITAWIKPSGAIGARWGLLMWRGTNGDSAGLTFGGNVNAGVAELGYNWNSNSATANNFHSGLYAPLEQWSFVALTITPTNSSLYLYYTDGYSVTNLSKAVQSVTNGNEAFAGGTIRIGTDNSAGRNFNGTIDEMAVFNHALSESQIQNLFLTGSGIAGVPPYVISNPAATPTNAANIFPGQIPLQLTASGSGAPSPGYQWQCGTGGVFTNINNGGAFSGATSGTLTINPVTTANYLDYQLVLTNAYGSATSSVYTVQLATVPNNGTWTARYQLTNSTGDIGWGVYYGSGSYSGPGVLGSGSFWNPLPGGGQWSSQTYTSVSDYQDNGSTHSGITCKMTGASVSLGMGGSPYASTNRAGLLTQYLYYFGSQANAIVFTNVPNGTYNLALHGDAPTWGRGTTFTVHGANGDQSDTTVNSSQSQYFINQDSSVVITNVTVANGGLSVDVSFATGQGPVNAAEIQLVSYALPTAGFTASTTTAFVGQGITFIDQSSPVTNVLWNFGDSNTYSTNNGTVSHSYAAPGTYTVSQTVKNPGGTDSVTKTAYITVVQRPTIASVGMSGGSLVLGGLDGIANQQYRVLSSTNMTLPLGSWKPVWTNVFANDGSYSYTNSSPTNNASFFILVSP